MIHERKHMLIKAYFVSLGLLVLAIAVMVRLIGLQTSAPKELRDFAMKTNFRVNKIEAQRGNLYANDGSLLAISVNKYDVFLDMVTVKEELFEDQIFNLSDSLSKMFGQSNIYYEKILRSARRNHNQYLKLAKNLSYFQLKRLKSFPILEKGQIRGGLIAQSTTKRVLPLSQMGNRTIGYDNEKGKAGLEGAYSLYLRGQDGVQQEQRINGNNWKPTNIWTAKEPIDGSDVYTTIDVRLQEIAFQALDKKLKEYQAKHGCVVVMDVKTGEVKAIVNLTRDKNGNYTDDRNYAVYEATEPGSSIKLASLMTAIEHGYVNMNTVINTGNGTYRVYKKTIRDSHPIGSASVKEIFENSSNVGVAKIIQEYYSDKPEKFVKQWQKWKLDQPLDIDIPGEGDPHIPHPDTKSWNQITLPWMAYGYATKLTPLQVLTFYNGVANDGVIVKPLFIKKIVSRGKTIKTFEPEIRKEKMASPETIAQVKAMMAGVVENGTAKSIKLEEYPLAGKTSTAQYEYWKKNQGRKYRASFVGYFPADKPQYSCIVVVHEPNTQKGFYGASVAAPVFKEIAQKIYLHTAIDARKYFTRKPASRAPLKQLPSIDRIKHVPDLSGSSGMEAIAKMENLGLKVKYMGAGKVVNQSLPPGTKIEKGKVIFLELRS